MNTLIKATLITTSVLICCLGGPMVAPGGNTHQRGFSLITNQE